MRIMLCLLRDAQYSAPDRSAMLINSSRTFAASLRSRRVTHGVTQDELAKSIGMSRRWVQEVEAGRVAPSLDAAIKLAEGLGLELQLLEAEEAPLLNQIFENLT